MATIETNNPDVRYRRKSDNCALIQVRTSAQVAIAERWFERKWGIKCAFVYANSWYHSFLLGDIPDELDAALAKRSQRRWLAEAERLAIASQEQMAG